MIRTVRHHAQAVPGPQPWPPHMLDLGAGRHHRIRLGLADQVPRSPSTRGRRPHRSPSRTGTRRRNAHRPGPAPPGAPRRSSRSTPAGNRRVVSDLSPAALSPAAKRTNGPGSRPAPHRKCAATPPRPGRSPASHPVTTPPGAAPDDYRPPVARHRERATSRCPTWPTAPGIKPSRNGRRRYRFRARLHWLRDPCIRGWERLWIAQPEVRAWLPRCGGCWFRWPWPSSFVASPART
jgi:hypothetical protein